MNVTFPAGDLESGDDAVPVTVGSEIASAEELGGLVIGANPATQPPTPITLDDVAEIDTAEVAQSHADVVIEPAVESIGLMAFDQLGDAIEAGRRAAAAALEANPDFVARCSAH